MIRGNIEGVRDSYLRELDGLYQLELEADCFLPEELLAPLVKFTTLLNRELMVYVSRDGAVLEVAIGNLTNVSLPSQRLRRNPNRLSGIRCIHSHPGGDARLSDVDHQALRMLKFDAMCAVGVAEGQATGVSAAFLGELEGASFSLRLLGPVRASRIPQQLWMQEIEEADRRVQRAQLQEPIRQERERALLVSTDSEESLDELASLAGTAGAQAVARVLQKRTKPDGATFIGSGKAEELSLSCQALDVDLVVVDDELTGAQQRNLEEILGVRVIDRTALILDIFAQRAQSREGKLQVELAQMKYRLPRLIGLGTVLSRLGGGIGTRGPGESQLESDRRVIRRRIVELERDLKEVSRQRGVRRAQREKSEQTVVALVGYTNAGKSTLLNALSGSEVLAEDKLFATLDPVMRRVPLPDNSRCLLVDTVGFIRKLPHDLVEAFKSTLEETLEADLLLIVSDAASPQCAAQRAVVGEVLEQLGASDKPMIEVLNKVDALPEGTPELPGAVSISAKQGTGLEELKGEIVRRIAAMKHRVRMLVPYAKGAVLSQVHERGQILSEEYQGEGTLVTAILDASLYQRVVAQLEEGTVELV